MELNIGDVVILKSGGPRMTIENIGDYSNSGNISDAFCKWFEGSELKQDHFNFLCIVKEVQES